MGTTADLLVTPFGPGIARPQAELQTLFHTSTLRLNSLLSHSSTVYSHFYTAQATYAQSIVEAHEKVDPAKDADLYAEWNLRPKLEEAPVLRVFEPCPGFLEEGVITLGNGDLGFDEPGGKAGLGPAPTGSHSNNLAHGGNNNKGEEVVVLQNKLAVARESRTRLNKLCVGWRGEIRRGRGVVQAYEENRGLGDPDEIVEAMMITLKDLSLAELKIEALDVEIGLLERALGDDQGAQKPHDFRNASFAIPTPCEYCKSSIWGITKPGSTCRKCGSNVHVKCANKVPAECTGGSSMTTASDRRRSYMFPRKESSTSQSISDLASIASTSKDKEESSLRAIRRSFTSRLHSSDSSSSNAPPPGLSPLAMATPVLPPPHRMTDMDNLDTTGIVGMGSNGSRLHSSASQPVLTSPIQREAGTGRRISMFGAPTGGVVSPGGSPMRRRSGDMLGGPSRGSPGGSPVIEEEVGGLDPSYRMNGTRSMDPSPNGTPGGLPEAKVLFDFEAADDDELTVEKGSMVHVIEPDDGQGWIKVRLEVQGDCLEGLVPAGYVELLPTGSTTPQYRPQVATHISPAVSPVAQPVTHHMSPVSSPVRHIASPGFPFNPPMMPGSYSPSSPPVPPMQSRPSIPTQGAFGQVTALYDYTAAESDEFALKKGVTYNLSRRGTSYDAGWWELSYDDGRTGIAPSNYLRKV
ncbi:hypothetical protein FFLO_05842 [Filobasidium floriforme]|uniref:SH3 domain-containing protein n=1 Tax=Filobasidium floriforme TaxID=5210 RepID=A0A8K0NL37_9TREE|nr:hypothetical protein FFLO_05842 [Filobasidium floriforme]